MYLFGIEKFLSTAQSTPACIAQCQREHLWRRTYAPTHTHTLSPTLAGPVLNHNPFRSKEHTVTRVAPVAGPLATAPRRPSCDPTHPTFRPSGSLALRPFGHRTPRFGWDGPPRRSQHSVTARVGDTRGKTERLSGERAWAQPGWQRHGGNADAG